MKSPSLNIISWNVNGIRAQEKKGMIDWVKNVQPDILCLQETKAHPEQLSDALLNIDGYHAYWSSAVKKGYSGVVIYSKIKPNKVTHGFGIEKFDSEGRIVEAQYDDFNLLNIYFPNGAGSQERLEYKLEFYDAALEYMEALKQSGKSLIVSGDYNTAHYPIDLARPEANSKTSGFMQIERDWLDKLVEHDYIDTFRHFYPDRDKAYTWWDMKTRARDRNVGWRIDYHFISKSLLSKLEEAEIHSDTIGSDHCPISIKIKRSK